MFTNVDTKRSFPELEQEIEQWWKMQGIMQKVLNSGDRSRPFVFFEGPPTANGRPGVHHIEARTVKDCVIRYHRMRGQYVIGARGGWDSHGLPVELEVEKDLGFQGKPDIEKYGIAEFNKACRQSVWRYVEEWEELTDRIAFWIDLEHPYVTYDNDYIESLWWILKTFWEQGLLFRDYKVTMHCPRCGTSLSDHEVSLGFEDNVDDPSVWVRFPHRPSNHPLDERLHEASFLAWTTTPWTLPANVALAVKPGATYVLVEFTGGESPERLVLAEALAAQVLGEGSYNVLASFTGDELRGLHYEPLFKGVPGPGEMVDWEQAYRIVTDDFVSLEDGTGIVHIAPAYGDLEIGRKYGLPTLFSVDLAGKTLSNFDTLGFGGMFFKQADPLITRNLKNMLMILSSVVLLIACANIANLLLARGTARRADVAVRMAMGAARRRLVRQMLTESVILAFIGGLAGLAVAYGGSQTILALAFPQARNIPVQASPSLPVLGFAFLVSLVTGVLFGIAPAWLSSHAQPADVLRGQSRTIQDRSSFPQKALVAFQAALSIVLLTGAILMTRSLDNLQHQNFGIQTENRYVFHLDPAGAGYTADRLPGLYHQIEGRFGALPGVKSIALAMYSPLEGDNWSEGIFVQGHPLPKVDSEAWATWDRVSPGFLDTIGVPILRGRDFTDQDTATTQPVAIVNQSFVKRFLPNEDPIGKHFGVDSPKYQGTFEIVGVVPDFKMNDPRADAHRLFLRPLPQQFKGYTDEADITGESRSMFIQAVILRFAHPQQEVEQTVRRTLASIDPNLTITNFMPYDEQVAGNFTQERLIARLSSLFGVLALILACVGLYGVMSYFVARRTGEIGIRMALGATRTSFIQMVLRGEVWQILIGLVLGIPASLYAGYLMKSLLYGVASHDLVALAGASLLLILSAAAAAIIPARRAASIEPMRALRTE